MYIEVTEDAGRAFFGNPPQGPIVMLNLLRFRAVADYSKSSDLAPKEPITGQEAYQLYAAHTFPLIKRIGSEVLFHGTAGHYLIGPAGQKWDEVLLVRHPSAQEFLAFASDKEYLAGLGHRTAALEDSRLLPVVAMGA